MLADAEAAAAMNEHWPTAFLIGDDAGSVADILARC